MITLFGVHASGRVSSIDKSSQREGHSLFLPSIAWEYTYGVLLQTALNRVSLRMLFERCMYTKRFWKSSAA